MMMLVALWVTPALCAACLQECPSHKGSNMLRLLWSTVYDTGIGFAVSGMVVLTVQHVWLQSGGRCLSRRA